MRASLPGALAALAMTGAVAAAQPVAIDRINGYLVYEDTGKMSRNVAGETNQILANGENGSSVQMIVDIVMSGPKNDLVAENTFLYVWATNHLSEQADMTLVDRGWPIVFVGNTGEVVRTVVIDHDCNGFEVHARVDRGDTIGQEVVKRFDLTCGD